MNKRPINLSTDMKRMIYRNSSQMALGSPSFLPNIKETNSPGYIKKLSSLEEIKSPNAVKKGRNTQFYGNSPLIEEAKIMTKDLLSLKNSQNCETSGIVNEIKLNKSGVLRADILKLKTEIEDMKKGINDKVRLI